MHIDPCPRRAQTARFCYDIAVAPAKSWLATAYQNGDQRDRATVPEELEINAWTDDGLVMGVVHRERPHHAVQFHPESILTAHGHDLLRNFLEQ